MVILYPLVKRFNDCHLTWHLICNVANCCYPGSKRQRGKDIVPSQISPDFPCLISWLSSSEDVSKCPVRKGES